MGLINLVKWSQFSEKYPFFKSKYFFIAIGISVFILIIPLQIIDAWRLYLIYFFFFGLTIFVHPTYSLFPVYTPFWISLSSYYLLIFYALYKIKNAGFKIILASILIIIHFIIARQIALFFG